MSSLRKIHVKTAQAVAMFFPAFEYFTNYRGAEKVRRSGKHDAARAADGAGSVAGGHARSGGGRRWRHSDHDGACAHEP